MYPTLQLFKKANAENATEFLTRVPLFFMLFAKLQINDTPGNVSLPQYPFTIRFEYRIFR